MRASQIKCEAGGIVKANVQRPSSEALRGFIAQHILERRIRPHTYALREWRATY